MDGLQPAMRDLLERALGYYDRFLQRHADDPKLREDLGATHNLIGRLHLALGERPKALTAWQKAHAVFAQLHQEQPRDVRWMRRLVAMTTNLATLQPNIQQVRAHLEQALALTEEFLKIHPDDVDLRAGKGHALANLGAAWERRGDHAQARRCYEQACEILRVLREERPERESVRRDLAFALDNLGGLRSHDPGGLTDALAAYDEASELREGLLVAQPGNPHRQADLAACLHDQAVIQRDAREPAKSRAGFARALTLRQALVERNPTVPRYQADLAATVRQVGFTLSQAGDKPAAIARYRQAIDLLDRVIQAAPDEPRYRREVGLYLFGLASMYGALDQRPQERDAYERGRVALEWLVARDGHNVDAHYHLARILNNLAYNRNVTGDPDEALRLVEAAAEHSRLGLERAPGHAPFRQLLNVHHFLAAEIHWKQHRPMASLEVIRQRQALWPGDGGQLYHSGKEIARLLAEPGLSAGQEQTLWRELESALRSAAGAGFRDWGRIQREGEWQTLRPDPRLREMLARVR